MLHAVIGVCIHQGDTLYVKRSSQMANYPGVWSLLSIQYQPEELPDQLDLKAAEILLQRMADQRLEGTQTRVVKYLTSGTCSDNPMRERVILHLYQISLGAVKLNPDYYSDAKWMTPDEYRGVSQGGLCGLCLRLWSDYSVRNKLTDKPFAPAVVTD